MNLNELIEELHVLRDENGGTTEVLMYAEVLMYTDVSVPQVKLSDDGKVYIHGTLEE